MANLPRNMIELVTGIKDDMPITKTYWTPPFLTLEVKYEALDLLSKINGLRDDIEIDVKEQRKIFGQLQAYIADTLYGKQFTPEELEKGLYGPTAFDYLFEQLLFASNGEQSDDTKKFLEKKN